MIFTCLAPLCIFNKFLHVIRVFFAFLRLPHPLLSISLRVLLYQAMHKLYRAHSASSPAAWSHKGRTPRPLPAPMPALTGEGWAGLSKVRWVNGGKHLISMSGKEKVLFQWAFDQDEPGLHDAMHTSPFAPKVDPRYAKQVMNADV